MIQCLDAKTLEMPGARKALNCAVFARKLMLRCIESSTLLIVVSAASVRQLATRRSFSIIGDILICR